MTTRVKGQASHFVWTNRSKESLTLDLKHAKVRLNCTRPICWSSGRCAGAKPGAPGAAARHGAFLLRPCTQSIARLIVCDISGYGDDAQRPGPYRDKKAYDLLIQSESGFVSVTGSPDAPAKAGCSIADIAAGMVAYSNILAALLQRGRTGQGCRIDVSMLEAMTEWMSFPLYYAFDGASPPPRAGAAHATIYPYGPFPAGDGKTVMLGLQNEREWQVFCSQVLQQPELAADPRFASNAKRVAAREVLRPLIVGVFARYSATQLGELLERSGIANARVNDMADVWAHPQLAARERWTTVNTPQGPVPALKPPGVPDGVDARMDPIPALGQHTDAVLKEIGLDDAAVAALRQDGAI